VSAVSPDWEIPITRPLLDRVATDEPGVVGGAAGDDRDVAHAAQQIVVDRVTDLPQVDPVPAGRAVEDRLGDRIRLLVDLLQHEGLVAALLRRVGIPVDLDDLALERLTGRGLERDRVAADRDDLVVVDVLDPARLLQEGGDRGGQERLTVAAADDQRALLARAHEDVGLVARQRDERVMALELVVGRPHGAREV